MAAALRMDGLAVGNLQGAGLKLMSGAGSGHVLYISGVVGDLVLTGFGEAHFEALKGIRAGDEVLIDNSAYLSSQTYHRHQVPSDDFYVWDQFRVAGGPVYPQRPPPPGPRFTWPGGVSMQLGHLDGMMHCTQTLCEQTA